MPRDIAAEVRVYCQKRVSQLTRTSRSTRQSLSMNEMRALIAMEKAFQEVLTFMDETDATCKLVLDALNDLEEESA